MSIANPFLYSPKHSDKRQKNNKLRNIAVIASVSVAGILIITKLIAYLMTDSVSLLSSLMDSTVDIMASIITLIGVKHAMEPADKCHRYGHGKMEALSAMAQAIFILGSAVFLSYEALHRFINPQEIQQVTFGYAVMILSIILTLALIVFQKYVVRKTGSVAIDADSMHYKGDLLMNIGVIAALFLTTKTGWLYFDPLFAVLIVCILLYGAKEVGTKAYDILVDRELPEDDRNKILSIARSHKEAKHVHDLRTRSAGHQVFIEFHLEMDADMSLNQAHNVTEEIEMMIYNKFPNSEVSIHQEPVGIADDRLDERIK